MPHKKPALCKALLNVSLCYVGDDTDFWLEQNDKITSFAKQPRPRSNFEKKPSYAEKM